MANSLRFVLTRTPEGSVVLASSANFRIYPRIDLVSRVVRWQLDKRRWHIAQIKSKSDINCSNRKLYNQKRSGRARHATKAAYQFRGGGKYAAKKVCVSSRLNKKLKNLAIRSCLSIKHANNSLFVLDSFSQLESLTLNKPLIVYAGVNEIRGLASRHVRKCVRWRNLSVLQTVQSCELVFSVHSIKMLDAKLDVGTQTY